jgi:esterase/lipase superfamily enzyme
LQLVVRDVQPEQVWIMANSMGAQVVVDAFSLLYQDRELADLDREIEHVVLTRGR